MNYSIIRKISLFSAMLLFGLAVQAQDETDYLLHNKYWRYKQRFYKNFVRIDWGGDGIGDFEEHRDGNPGWSGVYTKAGFSIPAVSHSPQNKNACIISGCGADIICNGEPYDPEENYEPGDCFFDIEGSPHDYPECFYNPYNDIPWTDVNEAYSDASITSNQTGARVSVPGFLEWGDDAGVSMGNYLAVLATEYELLRRNGQTNRAAQTLEEIYLCLQALRRLNMTANQWIQRYVEVTSEMPDSDFECNTPFEMDLSGYSGVQLRNDVPFDFWKEFHDNEFREAERTHPVYGAVNPEATDEYGGANPNDNCQGQPDGVPDIQFVEAGLATCGASKVQCGYTEEEAHFMHIQPDDEAFLAHEIMRKIFLSHDQIIALLRGMKLVDVFVPPGTIHNAPSGSVDLNELNADIVASFLQSASGAADFWLVYPCIGFSSGENRGSEICGYNMTSTKYAICTAIQDITGTSNGDACSTGVSNNLFTLTAIWATSTPIPHDASMKNMHYYFYNSLAALINLSSPNHIEGQMGMARWSAPWIEPFYPLLRKVMHQIDDQTFQNAGMNAIYVNSPNILGEYKDIMRQILGSYGCQGNCVPANPGRDCFSSQYPGTDIKCTAGYYYRPEEMTTDRIGQMNGEHFYNEYGNGLDYMLQYNLYHLVFMENIMNYYDTYSDNGAQGTNTLHDEQTEIYPKSNPNHIPGGILGGPPAFFDEDFPKRAFADVIESEATLNSNVFIGAGTFNAKAIYKASQAVELKPGFTVEPGAVFEAKIGELPQCDVNGNLYRPMEDPKDPVTYSSSEPIGKASLELLSSSVRIFPNPTSNRELNISLEGSFEKDAIQIRVFDIMGKEVPLEKQQKLGNLYQIGLPTGLASGVYYVNIISDFNRITKKVVLTD